MRTNRAWLVALGIVGTLAASRSARADDSETLGGRRRDYSSPQNFALELRFARYIPEIDENPTLSEAPYKTSFGEMARLEVAVEFDWQLIRIPHLGTIGPALSAGYTNMSNKAPLKNDPTKQSGETTTLTIMPFYGVVVLRADVFQREAHIPLVPYIKGGIGMALWEASNDAGTSSSGGVEGKGKSWGTQAAVGLALQLNAFDQGAARALDEETGVNNTYLFGEYMLSTLRGFGDQNKTLWVGTRTFLGGMTFEF